MLAPGDDPVGADRCDNPLAAGDDKPRVITGKTADIAQPDFLHQCACVTVRDLQHATAGGGDSDVAAIAGKGDRATIAVEVAQAGVILCHQAGGLAGAVQADDGQIRAQIALPLHGKADGSVVADCKVAD